MTRLVRLMVLASVVTACSSATGPQHLSFEARSTASQTSPITVQTVVTVTNAGNRTIQIEVSECGRPIEAFSTPERTGAPVWNSSVGVGCDLVARIRSLGPGDYYDYHLSGTMPADLPNGIYYLAVDMGYQLVPAGQVSKF